MLPFEYWYSNSRGTLQYVEAACSHERQTANDLFELTAGLVAVVHTQVP